MANEIAASIDIGELGLGAGGLGDANWQAEMLLLTREMRDALVQMSAEARRGSFFGGDDDSGFGILSKTLAKVGSLIAGFGVIGAYLVEAMQETSLDISELEPYLSDINKGQGSSLPPGVTTTTPGGSTDTGLTSFDTYTEGVVNTYANALEEVSALRREILGLTADEIDNENQQTEFANLQTELKRAQTQLQEEMAMSADKTSEAYAQMSNELQYAEAILTEIDKLLDANVNAISNMKSAQSSYNNTLDETLRKIKAVSRATGESRTVRKINESSARVDIGDRTYAVFDTPALGGVKAFEIR